MLCSCCGQTSVNLEGKKELPWEKRALSERGLCSSPAPQLLAPRSPLGPLPSSQSCHWLGSPWPLLHPTWLPAQLLSHFPTRVVSLPSPTTLCELYLLETCFLGGGLILFHAELPSFFAGSLFLKSYFITDK